MNVVIIIKNMHDTEGMIQFILFSLNYYKNLYSYINNVTIRDILSMEVGNHSYKGK